MQKTAYYTPLCLFREGLKKIMENPPTKIIIARQFRGKLLVQENLHNIGVFWGGDIVQCTV